MKFEKLALDSVRSKDSNGHLRVNKTVITKAAVNPYYGREIPNYENLGLEPNKVYHLLRDPEEIKKGMDTFKTKQLLIKHIPVNSTEPQKQSTIGAIGSELTFEDNKLYADLSAWDEQAIDLIESGKLQELSAGYAYTADMQAGEWQGVPYDGVMRGIQGNHVALVERGRIGRDAIICDGLPIDMELSMLKKGAAVKIATILQKIAMDGVSEESTKELVDTVAKNIEHKPAFDSDLAREQGLDEETIKKVEEIIGAKDSDTKAEDSDKKAEDEDDGKKADAERKKLEETDRDDRDAKKDDKAEDEKPAMDAAMIAMDAANRVEAKYQARDAVLPLVGTIAMDEFKDASSIYAYALKSKGIACDGVNTAGLKALVAQIATKEKPSMAQDSQSNASVLGDLGNYKRR